MASSDATPGGPTAGTDDMRAELSRVDAELADMRGQVRELRSQLADAGPVDPADRASVITQAEELEALAVQLERRREALAERLGESS